MNLGRIAPHEKVFIDIGGEELGQQAIDEYRCYKTQLLAGLVEAVAVKKVPVMPGFDLGLEEALEKMELDQESSESAHSHCTLESLLNAQSASISSFARVAREKQAKMNDK